MTHIRRKYAYTSALVFVIVFQRTCSPNRHRACLGYWQLLQLGWGVAVGTFVFTCLGLPAEGVPLQLVGLPLGIGGGPKKDFQQFVEALGD